MRPIAVLIALVVTAPAWAQSPGNLVAIPAPGERGMSAADVNAAFARKLDVLNPQITAPKVTGGISITGKPDMRSCSLLAQVSGGCPANGWQYNGLALINETQHGPGLLEFGASFELHVVTGQGGDGNDVNNAKSTLNTVAIGEAGGGTFWGHNNNVIARPGWMGQGLYGRENDVAVQNGRDCAPGGPCIVIGDWIAQGLGANAPGTIGSQVSGGNAQGLWGWHYGYHVNGAQAVKDVGFYDSSNDVYSFKAQGTNSQGAGFHDQTTKPVGFQADGSYSSAAMRVTGSSLVGMQVNGTQSTAGIAVNAATPVGVLLLSSNSTAAINELATSPNGAIFGGTHSDSDIRMQGTGPFGAIFAGAHATASIATVSDEAPIALSIRGGQKVCMFATQSCAYFDQAASRWKFTNSAGKVVMSVDDNGNLRTLGTVIQDTTP